MWQGLVTEVARPCLGRMIRDDVTEKTQHNDNNGGDVTEKTPRDNNDVPDNTSVIRDDGGDVTVRIIVPRRRIIIEPYLFLSSLFSTPLYSGLSQYRYMRIGQSFNASEDITMNHNTSGSCGLNKTTPEFILRQKIESAASTLSMELTLVYSVTSIIGALWLSSLSDKRGRKYALIPAKISEIMYCSALLAIAYWNLDLNYLFICEFLGSCFGGWETGLLASFAYLADMTSVSDRAFRIVVLELSFFLSSAATSYLTGYLIQTIGFTWIFAICTCGKALCFLYLLFLVPETIQPVNKVPILALSHFKYSFRIFRVKSSTRAALRG